jgi:hypothetical protein
VSERVVLSDKADGEEGEIRGRRSQRKGKTRAYNVRHVPGTKLQTHTHCKFER